MKFAELGPHLLARGDRNFERRIAPCGPNPRAAAELYKRIVDALVDQCVPRPLFELSQWLRNVFADRLQNADVADRLDVRDPDSERRQDARERMDKDPLHSERVGDAACMLPAGAAKA